MKIILKVKVTGASASARMTRMASQRPRVALRALGGLGLLLALAEAGCGPPEPSRASELVRVREDPQDNPLADLSPELRDAFDAGDALFEKRYFPAQGLGPLYIRTSCAACHANDGKGPGAVVKMAVLDDEGAPVPDALPYGHTARPFVAAGATIGIRPPEDEPGLVLSSRIGPSVFGRGYMEAVRDDEIERMQAEQQARHDGISGRIHRVTYASEPNPQAAGFHDHQTGQSNIVGRFGLKARIASLDEFAADALQGDMGLTSALRPRELTNPEGLLDDERAGVDVPLEDVNALAAYTRLIAIPRRADHAEGAALFHDVQCAVCHAPALRTRADYPIAALADIDAPLFTDLLLHDMGDALADDVSDGDASGHEWRTAPLMGLRFLPTYLHDGRAASVDEAVRAHGGEARDSVLRYLALSEDERAHLLQYVEGL